MRVALVAVLTTLVVAGCPQGLLPCRAIGDCTAPEICVDGTCVASCNSDADCGAGKSCVDGACTAGAPSEGEGASPGEGEGAPGEGEGSEGEGTAGEGEGEGTAGEGEGEGVAGEGEGEGASTCGNGAIDGAETCDDGNTSSGDGCSAVCSTEAGFACTSSAPTVCEQLPVADRCSSAQDPFHMDMNGDCIPDLLIGMPKQAAAEFVQGLGTGDFDAINSTSNPALGDVNEGVSLFGTTIAIEPDRGVDGVRGAYVSRPGSDGNGSPPEIWYAKADAGFVSTSVGALSKAGAANLGASLLVLRSGPNFEGRLVFSDGGSLFVADNAPPSTGATTPPTPVALSASAIVDGSTNAVKAVAIGPDEDGDGLPDVVVGTNASVFFVSSLTLAAVGRTFAAPGGAASFGSVVQNVGDVDGDGKDDLAIGSPQEGKGRLFVNLSSQGSALVEVTAPSTYSNKARFGQSVIAFGDVDGDGKNDLVVGAPFDDNGGIACSLAAPCAAGFTCTNGQCVDATNAPHCGTLLGDAGYTGNCAGAVAFVPSSALNGGGASVAAAECININQPNANGNSTAARFGTAIAALGPAPGTTTPLRIAIGLPQDSLRAQTGAVFVSGLALDGGGLCLLQNTLPPIPGPFAGGEFGATFGR